MAMIIGIANYARTISSQQQYQSFPLSWLGLFGLILGQGEPVLGHKKYEIVSLVVYEFLPMKCRSVRFWGNLKKLFPQISSQSYCFFSVFGMKNVVKAYFKQHLEGTAPKQWLKYTTASVKTLEIVIFVV